MDEWTFSDLLPCGILGSNGYVAATNATGPVGAPICSKIGIGDGPYASEQHLWLYDFAGCGVGVRCDPDRTLVGLNKTDASLRWLQESRGLSRGQSIIAFASRGIADNPVPVWLSFAVRHTDPSDWSKGSDIFVFSGTHAKAGEKPLWQIACEDVGIRSLSNPQRPFGEYDQADIAEVFTQAQTTEDWVCETTDPFAKLAGLFSFALSFVNDQIYSEVIGTIGSPREDHKYDLIQGLWEYHGMTYSCEMAYAWWRFLSYDRVLQDGSKQINYPLFPPNYFPTVVAQDALPDMTGESGDPGVRAIYGPFATTASVTAENETYASTGSGEATVLDKGTVLFEGGGIPIFGSESPDLSSVADLEGTVINGHSSKQHSLNYLTYTLQQMKFSDSPLCSQNPTGGKLQYLGDYDIGTGLIVAVSGPLFGGAVGYLYGFAIGDHLRPGGPGHAFPTPQGTTIQVAHQFWLAVGTAGNPREVDPGDPNAPDTFVNPGDWIIFDDTAQKYVAFPAWPQGITDGQEAVAATVELTPAADSVTRSLCIWDETVAGSVLSSGLPTDLAQNHWWTL